LSNAQTLECDPVGGPTVQVTSSNQGLVPNTSIVLGGSGANRLLTIVPRPAAVGATVITITASDEMATTTPGRPRRFPGRASRARGTLARPLTEVRPVERSPGQGVGSGSARQAHRSALSTARTTSAATARTTSSAIFQKL
jgi:hypothetical protein